MSSFSTTGLLGQLEQLVLLAVEGLVGQDNDAYAVSIRNEIDARTGINLWRGSVYLALQRLERKGYLLSDMSEPTPERGGKSKRCFALTAAGRRALEFSARAVHRMKDVPQDPAS